MIEILDLKKEAALQAIDGTSPAPKKATNTKRTKVKVK
jgi:hypothetical protein